MKTGSRIPIGCRAFPEPEVVLSQPLIEISHRNLVCK